MLTAAAFSRREEVVWTQQYPYSGGEEKGEDRRVLSGEPTTTGTYTSIRDEMIHFFPSGDRT